MEKKNIDPRELTDNFFEAIGKEWMLVTAGTKDKYNMMTASWGCLGWLWNKPVAVMFIRPERYTHELIERRQRQPGVPRQLGGGSQGLRFLRIEVGTRP